MLHPTHQFDGGFDQRPPGRRSGLTLAGKRIRKGCEVHQSGDYLNEVKMLQLCKSPYIVTLHGSLLTFACRLIVKELHPVSEAAPDFVSFDLDD